ncbi:rho guanine nucleotide exchange factor 37 isoform X2 [Pelobates cultripes]|uniref:Rho guanine nucleotide exchange factor 37 isoform X2 n=2 Tax=Pelobates cultripes TaxID=61616 RepID=A0AAD1RSC9_PELCU|nr:rho guanine nucleotide exchange factor 37 isoform X2 [Pelobates cultripes]
MTAIRKLSIHKLLTKTRSSDYNEKSYTETANLSRKISIVHLKTDTSSDQNCFPSSPFSNNAGIQDASSHENVVSKKLDSTPVNWEPTECNRVNILQMSMSNSSQKSSGHGVSPQARWRDDDAYASTPQSSYQSHETKVKEEGFYPMYSDDDDDDDDNFYNFFNEPPGLRESEENPTNGASSTPWFSNPTGNERQAPVVSDGYSSAATGFRAPGDVVQHIPQFEDHAEGLSNTIHPAVAELIDTEESYFRSLQFIISYIKDKLKGVPEVDVHSLFSNIEEIFQMTRSFSTELNQTKNDEKNQLVNIGILFQEYCSDMENVYSRYCCGYQRALTLLDQYKETHIFENIQEALATESSSSCQYTDITFYLVKPMQRVTKYPLLVQRILEIKSISKEAKDALEGALQAVMQMNTNINENKRRKEVASKYVQEDQRTLLEKVYQINKHTLSKKKSRLSQLLKQQAGIVPKKEDKEYDSLAKNFQCLASVVSQLHQNVLNHVNILEELLTRQPDISCMEEEAVSTQYKADFTMELYQNIYLEFKRRLQLLVLQPLTSLLESLKGPKNLIRKRMDKLLDCENLEEKYSETGKMTLEEEEIIKNYKAIHTLLLSELPLCIALSKQLLRGLLFTYIELNHEMTLQGLNAAQAEASQLEHRILRGAEFMKWVDVSIRQSSSQLKEFEKKFVEQMPAPPVQDQSPAQDHQVQSLLKRYGTDKIYQVMQAATGSKNLDLTLKRGDFVAVLQYSDTKGSKSRWLVDTGGSRGYVQSSKLQPYQGIPSRKNSLDSLSPLNNCRETRRHSSTAQECPYSIYSEIPIYSPFQDVALYAFNARSSYEVSLKQGEPVVILEPHDKKGSPEWSLVEVGGRKGYVPSNHLGKVQMPNSPSAASIYR